MAGIVGDNLTETGGPTVTVEHDDTNEIFLRYVRADGKRCAAADIPIGVCKVKSKAKGEFVPVQTDGIVVVEAGAAIVLSEGAKKVKPDADGRAPCASGSPAIRRKAATG